MSAALTISVLLACSVAIVRIASVAMRLTGLPDDVARFQSVSALTGAGFTTRESEMIVNYPVRRKILMILMVLGNLGLVSVASTFIVAFVDADQSTDAMVTQSLAIAIAICLTLLVMTNKHLDRLMCHFIGLLLSKVTALGARPYQRTLQIDEGYSVAEHVFRGSASVLVGELPIADFNLKLLAVRNGEDYQVKTEGGETELSAGDILVCYGSDTAHDRFGLFTRYH
ncbi:hypothetical protein [Pelagibius sp. Alg239-R121]|uniref:hypothetical protein n=1 Tax=Pelagibius sp. Alg239-R121 TaxID=2993448 RepID=UPI0024A6327A|nr:hypothetical protein [Pelagibius sp. Alg239-R121]